MSFFLRIIDDGNLLALLFAVYLLCMVGNANVLAQPRMRHWGLRVACGVFVAYGLYGVSKLKTPDAWDLAGVVVRALLAAGLVLGPAWIALAVVGFVHEHGKQRAAAARSRAEAQRRERERRREEASQAAQRQRDAEEQQRAGPERERLAREAEARRQAGIQALAEAARRRQAARQECEFLYQRHAVELAERLPPDRFQAYLDSYLSSDRDLAAVEHAAEELRKLIADCLLAAGGNRQRFASLPELTASFAAQRQAIQADPHLDPVTREAVLASLAQQEHWAMAEFLKR